MMNNKEIEIRFSDLLAMMLKSLKMIIALALILGLLGCAYGVCSALREQPRVTLEDVEAAETNVALAKSRLTSAENALSFRDEVTIPNAKREVERAELLVQQLQEYRDNSIYYGMNPYHHGAARLRFTVETDYAVLPELAVQANDPRIGIVNAYIGMRPFDSETLDKVLAILGIEVPQQYIAELISVRNINDYLVEIRFYYDDLQVAEKVVNYLYETMTARGAEMLSEHQAKVLTVASGYETDQAMNDNLTAFEKNLTDAEEAFRTANKSYQAALSNAAEKTTEQAVTEAAENLIAAENALQSAQANYANNRPNVRHLVKELVKTGLAGGLIGAVLGCFFALCKSIFGGVIQNQNEVMNRYAFPLIGVLPRTKKQWFDASIRKLEGEPTGSFDATAQATAQSLLARIGEKSVCLVSTGDGAVARKLAAYTDDALPVIGSIIGDANAVKELAKYDGIVLVEERGRSRVDLVDAEVLRAEALHKDIIGIVLA